MVYYSVPLHHQYFGQVTGIPPHQFFPPPPTPPPSVASRSLPSPPSPSQRTVTQKKKKKKNAKPTAENGLATCISAV